MSTDSATPELSAACRRTTAQLDDFVDGRLDDTERLALSRHLRRCSACRRTEGELRSLLDAAETLPLEVAPEHDLWPAIAERLGERRPAAAAAAAARWHRPMRLAAAAVVLLACGALLSRWLWPVPGPATALLETQDGTFAAASDSGFELAESELLKAKEALWLSVYHARDELSPSTREAVENNLRVLDLAIHELRLALDQDPGNHQLEGQLLASHRREVELLRRLAQTPL